MTWYTRGFDAPVYDVEQALRDAGIESAWRDRKLKALCPFHADSNPSLGIDIERQLWYCWPCGRGGTVEGLLRELKIQSTRYWTGEGIEREDRERPNRLLLPHEFDRTIDNYALKMAWIHSTWPFQLSPYGWYDRDAIHFMEGRKLDPIALSRAGGGVCRALPVEDNEKIYLSPEAWHAGKSRTHRLAALAYDTNGDPMSFQARDVTGTASKKDLWLAGVKTAGLFFANRAGVYLLRNFTSTDGHHPRVRGVIICEGLTDFWAVTQRVYTKGLGCAVLGGTSGSFRYLEQVNIPAEMPVYVWTDPDDTGDRYLSEIYFALGGRDIRVITPERQKERES